MSSVFFFFSEKRLCKKKVRSFSLYTVVCHAPKNDKKRINNYVWCMNDEIQIIQKILSPHTDIFYNRSTVCLHSDF